MKWSYTCHDTLIQQTYNFVQSYNVGSEYCFWIKLDYFS